MTRTIYVYIKCLLSCLNSNSTQQWQHTGYSLWFQSCWLLWSPHSQHDLCSSVGLSLCSSPHSIPIKESSDPLRHSVASRTNCLKKRENKKQVSKNLNCILFFITQYFCDCFNNNQMDCFWKRVIIVQRENASAVPALRRPRQKGGRKFQASLGYAVRPCDHTTRHCR